MMININIIKPLNTFNKNINIFINEYIYMFSDIHI